MNPKDIPQLDMNDKVLIFLDEIKYFDPTDNSKEVELISKKEMKQRLGIMDYLSEKHQNQLLFRENKIIPLDTLVGTYIGSVNFVLNIKPYYGLLSSKAEYFTIPLKDVVEIRKIKVE